MTNIDKVGAAGFDPSVTFTDPLSRLANRTLEDVPPAADGKTVPLSDLPTLEAPAHALSIERLVAAIGNEMRRQGVREGLDAIDSQAQEIDQKYSEKLAEIAKEIDKKENQSIWDKICKVFRCIGMALGFIASIATIAAGSAMGNPALIVAGVAATIFLGGWMPLHIAGWEGFNAVMDCIPGFVWFFAKAFFVVWLLMWIKWTFPRLRIDQILTLEWKYLVPIGLANLLLMVIVVVFKLHF